MKKNIENKKQKAYEITGQDELYKKICSKDVIKAYKKKCTTNRKGDIDYTGWKDGITTELRKAETDAIENCRQRIIHYKHIEDTLMSVPETIIGFIFGGALAPLIFKWKYGIFAFILGAVIIIPIYMCLLRKVHSQSEFYETLLEVIQEELDSRKCTDADEQDSEQVRESV